MSLSTLSYDGLYKAHIHVSNDTPNLVEQVEVANKLTVNAGDHAKAMFKYHKLASTKRYESKGALAPGTAAQKSFETINRVFNTQKETCEGDDIEMCDGYTDGDKSVSYKRSEILRQEHILKPCGISFPGAARKFTDDMIDDLLINTKQLEQEYLDLMRQPSSKFAQGNSTLSIEEGMTTVTSSKALSDLIFLLRLNGIIPSSDSCGALTDAVLKLLAMDKIMTYVYDFTTKKRLLREYSSEEYKKLICTIKPVLKGEEKGKKERRAIWVVTMILKILLNAAETAHHVFLTKTPYECITYGGLAKDERISSTINNPAAARSPRAIVVSSDKTKWNETISFAVLWEITDRVTQGWSAQSRIQVLSGIKTCCTKIIMIPRIKIYNRAGRYLEVDVDDLDWSQLSTKWQKDCFDEDEMKFKMYMAKIKAAVKLPNDRSSILSDPFMGMGLLGKASSTVSIVACHQGVRKKRITDNVNLLVASDDAIIVIGSETYEDAKIVLNNIIAAEKMLGITTSAAKTICQVKSCGQDPMGEYTTMFQWGADNQTPATQKALVIGAQAEDLATAVKTSLSVPKSIMSTGGLMPGLMAKSIIDRNLNMMLCLGHNEEDIAEFCRVDTRLYKKRKRPNRWEILKKMKMTEKTPYTSTETHVGPLTCGNPVEYGIINGNYDESYCLASDLRTDTCGIDTKGSKADYSNYSLKPPSSQRFIAKMNPHQVKVQKMSDESRVVMEGFTVANYRLADGTSNVIPDRHIRDYLSQNVETIVDPDLKRDVEFALSVYDQSTDNRIKREILEPIYERWCII